MPKVTSKKSHTQILTRPDPKKHSVLFHEETTDAEPMFKGLYLMRDAARKLLNVDNLDKVDGIKVTVEIL